MAQKIVSVHRFQYMNTDVARELLGENEAVYMLNCNTMSTAAGNVGIVTNLKGNVLVEIELPEGINEVIGTAKDEEVDKFYYFLWNSEGFHGIYRYDGLLNAVDKIMENITDTGGIDVLRFNRDNLILMTDVVKNDLLYWVQKDNPARKINIKKALDKSDTGYGVITEEFVSAYKLAPYVAPVASYFSDTNIQVNRLYGSLFKFAVRYIYDDGEVSNWSDFSNAPVPPKEAFTGVNFVPTDNNGINVVVPTGSKIVTKIEIASMRTIDGGYSNWDLVVTLDKEKLDIGDDTEYVYAFYNDGSYITVDQEKIIRPYSFLPDSPLLQAFVNNAMVYGNFNEGFEDVDIDVTFDDVIYEPLFLDDSVENSFNSPNISLQVSGSPYDDYFNTINLVTYINGTTGQVDGSRPAEVRARRYKLTIGSDVKQGNNFVIRFFNGYSNDAININYIATNNDNAESVLNKLKQQLINTGKLLRKTPDLMDTNVYNNIDESGNKAFYFIIRSTPKKQYLDSYANVDPVEFSTLKDTGQSVPNMKLGTSIKFGIVYEDFQGRRSLVYTDVNMIVKTDTQNDLNGIKKVKIILNINHKPPAWAKAFQIVRTADLVYGDFIQMLIQEVEEVELTPGDTGEYLDLIVGSLYTYQKIHPNTTLRYEFKKGDRIRLISKDDGSYYDFLETEILEYNETVTSDIQRNVTIDGTTAAVTVDADVANIGKSIIIDGNERTIIDAPDSTTYTLNSPIGKSGEDATFLSYQIIDRRGSIRIRKPNITIEDESLIEIFTPSVNTALLNEQFYYFNKKFNIINAGLETRQHFGDIQSQTDVLPAKISITEGTIYVRSREMPTTNELPAQVTIRTIEDPSYSDFYFSLINDNGKVNIEDQGFGVVHFGSRLRFSNNYIEDTRINGLNDFDNLDREDYNDKYGDINLLVFADGNLLAFKELKDCIIPVFQTIIQDNSGVELLGTSSKLLNKIRYYSHQGGIGNNPESYCSEGSRHYHVSANSGCFVRLGGDGLTPISEVYFFDNEGKRLLREADKNGAKILSQYDVGNSVVVFAIRGYSEFTFNSVFNQVNWKVFNDRPNEDTPLELLTAPDHVSVSLSGQFVTIESTDYVGKDSFMYRGYVNGVWVEKNICLEYKDLSNRQTAWRPRFEDAVCELEEGENTGRLIFITLEQYYTDNGEGTGQTKPNAIGDPDYVQPIVDLDVCPFDGEVFYSIEKSGSATKNNCPSGQTGSTVMYIVPAGQYTSVIDQDTADAKAQADVDANKQAYANSTGTCTAIPSFGNDAKSQIFNRNNCPEGQIGSAVTYSVPANKYYRATKELANQAAQDEINANGQTYANSTGVCEVGNTFTFEVVMYSDYRNAKYDPSDSRGVSFRFVDTPSVIRASHLVNTLVTRNAVVHTYNVSYVGSTIFINGIIAYQALNAAGGAGVFGEKIYIDGVLFATNSSSIGGSKPDGYQYEVSIYTGSAGATIGASSVVRLVHGTEPITYYNVEKFATATKNDCEEGEVGSEETLIVPAGTFTSTIDQLDADTQAQNYADANAQAYANANGTCTPTSFGNDERSGTATKNDCPEGQTGSTETYVVPADTYYAPTKEEANADAEADVADNKQEYADTVGECTPAYYEASDDAEYAIGGSESGSCAATFDQAGYLYTTNSDGILNAGDIVYILVAGEYVPYSAFSPEGYISYLEGGIRVYIRVYGSDPFGEPVGEVLIKGDCKVPVDPITCASEASYEGGASFPTVQPIELGTAIGRVYLQFDGQTVPDKFIVDFDGVDVIDTGYRGNTSQQAALNAALASKGLPPETITGGGTGTVMFNKTTATSLANVNVYAPMPSTGWDFKLLCPISETLNMNLVVDTSVDTGVYLNDNGNSVQFRIGSSVLAMMYGSSIKLYNTGLIDTGIGYPMIKAGIDRIFIAISQDIGTSSTNNVVNVYLNTVLLGSTSPINISSGSTGTAVLLLGSPITLVDEDEFLIEVVKI